MKALVKARAEKGIWLQDVPEPTVGINDVKIKIKKTAICGTDLHIYKWDEWAQNTIQTPMTIGHEYVGVVAEVGNGVKNIQVGDRVTGEGHIACGHCRNCRRGKLHVCENTIGVGVNRDGAFAEYLVIPAENVVKLDDRISDEMAAIMDPFGNATHTALSFPLIGEDVLITGAGLIGSMEDRPGENETIMNAGGRRGNRTGSCAAPLTPGAGTPRWRDRERLLRRS